MIQPIDAIQTPTTPVIGVFSCARLVIDGMDTLR